MKEQPQINIPTQAIDRILEMLAILGLITLVSIPIVYYLDLPSQIPIHYDAQGVVDTYGDKILLLVLTAIGTVLFLLLTFLNTRPHKFSYPTKITSNNAFVQYRLATRLIRFLKTISMLAFAFISYQTVDTALGLANGLGTWFLPVLLIFIFGSLLYYIIRMLMAK